MTMEDYLHFEEEAFKTLNHGDIVDGVVVRVDPDEVLVDVGAKAEGVISNKELGFRGEADAIDLEPGDQIKVYVLQSENEEGNVVLSLRRARSQTTWLWPHHLRRLRRHRRRRWPDPHFRALLGPGLQGLRRPPGGGRGVGQGDQAGRRPEPDLALAAAAAAGPLGAGRRLASRRLDRR